jgi:mono/diheme cytochrome c family protein
MFKPLLITLALTAALTACLSDGRSSSTVSGSAIFHASRCADCHGKDLAGSKAGPSLLGLADRWQRDDLAAFLADPDAVVSRDARLGALDMEYPQDMPAFGDLTDREREALASWLLTK